MEKLALRSFHKKNPDEISSCKYPVQKQALIIDNTHDHEWQIVGVGASFAAVVVHFLPFAHNLALFAASLAVAYGSYTAAAIDLINIRRLKISKDLSSNLRNLGYDVSIVHKFNGKINESINLLKQRASDLTASIFIYEGHGGRKSKASLQTKNPLKKLLLYLSENVLLWGRLLPRSSYLVKGKVPDFQLVPQLADMAGSKVVVINACHAGGFVRTAASLPSERTSNLMLATTSNNGFATKLNPLMSKFVNFAKKGAQQPVSEFFELHSGKGRSGIKQLVNSPRVFVGSNMRALKL